MKNLIDAIVAMEEDEAMAITDALLEAGEDPLKVLGAYRTAMVQVGRLFEKGEFFLPELILSGEMLNNASQKIKPILQKAGEAGDKHGRVILGTVEGDIHDIGKNIVVFMLDINGFEVMDLGVDVCVRKFVDAAGEFRPQVIGLSGLLTLAYDPMKATIEALQNAGLRDDIKVMIGGGQMDNHVRDYVGADAYGKDAVEAVRLCSQWICGDN